MRAKKKSRFYRLFFLPVDEADPKAPQAEARGRLHGGLLQRHHPWCQSSDSSGGHKPSSSPSVCTPSPVTVRLA